MDYTETEEDWRKEVAEAIAEVRPSAPQPPRPATSPGRVREEFARERNGPPDKPSFAGGTGSRLLSIWELEQLPEPEWLIDGLLPKGGLTVLFGKPGAGKSFLALDWAMSVAGELNWCGRGVSAEDVLYVSAEGATGLRARVPAWRSRHRQNPDRIAFRPVPVNMRDKADVRQLIQDVRSAGLGPGLIVIDTLARCFGGGEENSVVDMGAFILAADELSREFDDATVLVVHHSGKDPSRGERGHSSLAAAANTMMRLEISGTRVTLSCTKQKEAKEFEKVPLKLVEHELGDGQSSCTIEPISSADTPHPHTGADGRDPRALENERRALCVLSGMGPAGAGFAQWMKAAGLKKSTFKDTLSRLLRNELVVKEGRTYRLARRGPKAETGTEQGRTGPT